MDPIISSDPVVSLDPIILSDPVVSLDPIISSDPVSSILTHLNFRKKTFPPLLLNRTTVGSSVNCKIYIIHLCYACVCVCALVCVCVCVCV